MCSEPAFDSMLSVYVCTCSVTVWVRWRRTYLKVRPGPGRQRYSLACTTRKVIRDFKSSEFLRNELGLMTDLTWTHKRVTHFSSPYDDRDDDRMDWL
jgi:hypothetical protein